MLQEILNTITEAIKLPISYFILPTKRISILYLSTSLLLTLYIYLRHNPKVSFMKYIFHKSIWLSKSAQVDYSLFIVNSFIKVIAIAPIVVLGIYLQEYISYMLQSNLGVSTLNLNRYSIVFLYTFVLWLFSDFASFYVHYLMHKIPFFWRFHKIHHSATVLNPITQYRIHPVELIINNVKGIIVFGLTTGLFYYLANGKIGIIGFLGVNIFKFVFLTLGSNLRHSHVKFTFPRWLEYIIISPYQHQIHHSDNPKHYDKNIGSHLAIWDWIFNTLVLSVNVTKIKFGLGYKENTTHNSLMKNLTAPIKLKKD
jgi:sterol desaturase/sphingolipid hydroxylase (fatty acid hydroxylase superfamily)